METNEIVVPAEYTEAEVAALTGLRRQTLRAYRCRKVGIPYIKRGNTIAYRQDDVHAFLQGQRIETSTALATEQSYLEGCLEEIGDGHSFNGAAI
jgi:DNA-binding transcriptional MerR regulator